MVNRAIAKSTGSPAGKPSVKSLPVSLLLCAVFFQAFTWLRDLHSGMDWDDIAYCYYDCGEGRSRIFHSISRLPTSSTRSSPPVTAISAALSLRPTPSLPLSPIAWWKTLRSSFWEAKVFAKVIRASPQLNNRLAQIRRRSVTISRTEKSLG